MNVFISHSSQDERIALRLKEELEKLEITVWIAEENIAVGEEIVYRIFGALKKVDFVLVLLSKVAVKSEWVKREVAARLMDDLTKGKETIIPVLIDDVEVPYVLRSIKWIDCRRDLRHGLSQLKKRLNLLDLESEKHQAMFELFYFLIMIDQFKTGIWGASLGDSVALYGHKDDPGSITISTYCSIGITKFTGSKIASPIQNFRKYLLARQSEDGAFGMINRYPGLIGEVEILKHARHTATALRFFLFYDGLEDSRVKDALNYLLKKRTPKGLWVDHGELIDENSDPITVAFIIDSLEQVYGLLSRKPEQSVYEVDLLEKIKESIVLGLEYVFNSPFRDQDGFWMYKYKTENQRLHVVQNLYQYSTDVLANICGSCLRLSKYTRKLDEILLKLIKITDRYAGLPCSPSTAIPNFDATASLIAILNYYPNWADKNQEIFNLMHKNSLNEEVVQLSKVNDWASVLHLYGSPIAPYSVRKDEKIKTLADLCKRITMDRPGKVKLPSEFDKYSKWVKQLLERANSVVVH